MGAAVSRSEMGLDVLDYRTVNEKIAFKICTDEEMRQFEAAEDKQKFLQLLWCKKESAVKKTGVGFTAGFKTVKTEELDFSIKIFPLYTAAVCGGGEIEFKEISWKELIK